ncbi:MAG: hypothetical protein FWF81_15475 [Defluviitaleaceae bacterium]|nr:hypothetical protein [Defluviitaleaceae bacterium]
MDIITQAKELVFQILEMTQSLVLTGEKEHEESEVAAYISLVDEREPMVDELADLRLQLDNADMTTPEFEEIKKAISKIAEVDKEHVAFMGKLHKGVQSSYKEIKQGQRLYAGYNPLPGDEVASKIDLKH